MYSNGISLNASSYGNLFTNSTGSLSVPVNPNAVIYTQLDYVHGFAASSGQNGVPVNRLRILNSLIHQLVTMKQKPSASVSDFSGMDNSQQEAMIKNMQQQISKAAKINAETGTAYGLQGLMPEVGNIISIKA